MTDVEVKVAIAVEISECRRRGPIPVTAQAGHRGDVVEGSVAIVAEKGIRPPSRDEQVRAAVAVDVAHRDSMAVSAGNRLIPEASVTSVKCPFP